MSDAASSPSPPKQSWLTTLPGLLTTLGAFIAVLTGFFTLIAPLWSPPEIKFSVTPPELRPGGKALLDWSVTNARQVKILPEIGQVGFIGRRSVQPRTTTTYTLIAKRFFAEARAEYEIHVVPEEQHPGSTRPSIADTRQNPDPLSTGTPGIIQFSNYQEGLFLSGNEFVLQNIQQVIAAPSENYCQNAQAAILPAGSYRSRYSFLTTAAPDDMKRCNNVPVRIYFNNSVREVTIHFSGAHVPYELRAYSKDGSVIYSKTEKAASYVYTDYEISLVSDTENIAWVEFGYETALTMIRDIEFRQ